MLGPGSPPRNGAQDGIRTHDLILTKNVLYLLSYLGDLLTRWAEKDSNLRRRCQLIYSQPPLATWVSAQNYTIDLETALILSRRRDLNPQPTVYKTVALPIELRRPVVLGTVSRVRRPESTKRIVYGYADNGQISTSRARKMLQTRAREPPASRAVNVSYITMAPATDTFSELILPRIGMLKR